MKSNGKHFGNGNGKVRADGLEATEEVLGIPVAWIMPDPEQPRQHFDENELLELAASLKTMHQVQPIIVRKFHGPGDVRYMIVAGERRWRAHRIARKEKIQAIIREYATDLDRDKESLLENVGRVDVPDLDLATKLDKMKKKYGLTLAELAQYTCRPDGEGWVSQRLMLLQLHPDIQSRLNPARPEEERITFSLAVRLAPFEHPQQLKFMKRIMDEDMPFKAATYMLRMASIDGDGKAVINRSPSKDREMVNNSISRMSQDVKLFLKMGGTMFARAFSTQSRVERKHFLEALQTTIEELTMLKEEIETVPCAGG